MEKARKESEDGKKWWNEADGLTDNVVPISICWAPEHIRGLRAAFGVDVIQEGTFKCAVKLFYQFKAGATYAYGSCISDADVSIVSLIRRQVIHLTWRLLDQRSTCSRQIP